MGLDTASSASGNNTSFGSRIPPTPAMTSSALSTNQSGSYTLGRPSSRESACATPIHMRRLSTPRLESPRLDSYRYSLINLEESLEHDLDAILGELCALESNFGKKEPAAAASSASSTITNGDGADDTPSEPPPPPAPLQLEELLASEPQYISPEAVRQNKLSSRLPPPAPLPPPPPPPPALARTDSPDNDSAFCEENTSSNSSNGSSGVVGMLPPPPPSPGAKSHGQGMHGHAFLHHHHHRHPHDTLNSSRKVSQESSTSSSSCSSSVPGGLHHAKTSFTHRARANSSDMTFLKDRPSSPEDAAAKAKAEKIRLAIEKIKEASVKKIFIKVFGEDGSAKSLLVDERMTVAQVCRMLAEKHHVKRDTSWGLVELLPDLHMERAYEDHEPLVENLLMWKADSKNTLWFIKRPEVYDLFNRPEMYLLGDTCSQSGTEMDERARAELVEEYFSSTGVGAPEVEGHLWLKAEGKKTWKKFYFVLRTSGLYYAPKGKKTSKDLVCLARFDVNQVYFGVKWQPKFKSPTKHCLAIKHPQIQAKNPKYIRYLCADTEAELNKWVTGVRLAKYGRTLYENYRGIIEEMAHDDLDRLASARNSSHDHDQIQVAPANQQQQQQQHILNHSTSSLSELARTPDSAHENRSLDSALQMSDAAGPVTTTVIVHSSQQGGVQCRSSSSATPATRSSSGSLSERSSAASDGSGTTRGAAARGAAGGLSSVEQGFNCDSPEGGTIKKKPAVSAKGSLVTFRPEQPSPPTPTPKSKEVRFKDTFSSIPDDLPPPSSYATMRRAPTITRPSQNEHAVYQNIESILSNHRHVLQNLDLTGSMNGGSSSALQRRYSQESLVSNPAMLHSGTLISKPQQSQPGHNKHPNHPIMQRSPSADSTSRVQLPPSSPTPNGQPRVLVSPQPQRPAPVLKPQLSRKPSVDKGLLLKKQQMVEQQQLQQRPSYEDTLKKCQSLTRHNSSPNPPTTPLETESGHAPASRQMSCPDSPSSRKPSAPPPPACPDSPAPRKPGGSPVVPPKPRGLKLDASQKISHLPPTGRPQPPPQSARSSSLGRNPFLSDLENAMSSRRRQENGGCLDDDDEEEDGSETSSDTDARPFPNRLSSGEYDNVSNGRGVSPAPAPVMPSSSSPPQVKGKKAPPLPKRNEETHLTWNRS